MDRIELMKQILREIKEIKRGYEDSLAGKPANVMGSSDYYHGYFLKQSQWI